MLTLSAPETLQISVDATPILTAAGLAEKEVMTGRAPGLTGVVEGTELGICGTVVDEGVFDDEPGLWGVVTVMHPDSAARAAWQIISAINRERLFMLLLQQIKSGLIILNC
jgi:hypothetical protein